MSGPEPRVFSLPPQDHDLLEGPRNQSRFREFEDSHPPLPFDPFDPNLTLSDVTSSSTSKGKSTPSPSQHVPAGCVPLAEIGKWRCGNCAGRGWNIKVYWCDTCNDFHSDYIGPVERCPESERETCDECHGSGMVANVLASMEAAPPDISHGHEHC